MALLPERAPPVTRIVLPMVPLVGCAATKQIWPGRERIKAFVKRPMTTELILVRHAPTRNDGLLAGRTDVPADCSDTRSFVDLRAAIGDVDHRVASPARRCIQTAASLWPDLPVPAIDARLWEQDFGDWEGLAHSALPDLGPLPPAELAAHRPPNGESFGDLCARVHPVLEALAARGGRIAVIAHAGTLRAALALALNSTGAALAFQLAPLSVTHMTAIGGSAWSIGGVNWTPRGVRQ